MLALEQSAESGPLGDKWFRCAACPGLGYEHVFSLKITIYFKLAFRDGFLTLCL